MDPQDYAMLKLHAHHGAQKAADGVTSYLENSRMDYLEARRAMDMQEAAAQRMYSESGGGRARQTSNEAPANR